VADERDVSDAFGGVAHDAPPLVLRSSLIAKIKKRPSVAALFTNLLS